MGGLPGRNNGTEFTYGVCTMRFTGHAETDARVSPARAFSLACWVSIALAACAAVLTGCAGEPAGPPAATASAPAGEGQLIAGKVLYVDGRAADGATVTAYQLVQKYMYLPFSLKRIGHAAAADDGGFSFRTPPGAERVLLVADKPGQALGWEAWTAEQAYRPIKIELAAPCVVSGRVLDEDGKPVAKAKVNAYLRKPGARRGWYLGGHEQLGALVATTGADGRFSFDKAPVGADVQFTVEAPGHGGLNTFHERRRRVTAPAADVELELPPEAKIEAAVVEKETGKPVADVALFLIAMRKIEYRLGQPVPGKPGRFRWSGIPPARCWIDVAVPTDGLPAWAVKQASLEAKAGETTEVILEAVRGQIVEVSVVDAESKEPVQNAHVSAWNPKGRWSARGNTGRSGVARMRAAPGEYIIGFVGAPRYSSSRTQTPFTVEPNRPAKLELTLTKAPRLHGVVLDASGAPVPGAVLSIVGDYGSAEADGKGRFEIFRDFREQAEDGMVLLARQEDRNLAAVKTVTDHTQPVELRLQSGVAHDVRVLTDDGKPIADAHVTVTLGQADPDSPSGQLDKTTDSAGGCRIAAIPPGLAHSLRAQAKGRAAAELFFPAGASQAGRVEKSRFRLRPVRPDAPAPVVEEVDVPEIPGAWAIWGATGRDQRGHVWFGVTAHEVEAPSAHLFEYVPQTNKLIDRGDVVGQLKKAGILRQGEQQMKIHTKIYQVGDWLYFASMDEKGEDEYNGVLPIFGGHLWRMRLSDNSWEHLLSTREALIALTVGGGKVYALGYWDHVLFQYDTETGKTRSVKVGALAGHVSRNILADGRGHVYVPRVTMGAGGQPAAALVEYDASLKEIGQSPLRFYFNGPVRHSHGIIGRQPLPDGSIAFLTHNGYLSIVKPAKDGPASLENIGWFHPSGPQYAGSLFLDDTGRYLMGAVHGRWDEPYEWVAYDLKTGTHHVAPFRARRPEQLNLGRASLYGSETRDEAGGCYVVGTQPRGEMGAGSKPIVLKVVPGKLP